MVHPVRPSTCPPSHRVHRRALYNAIVDFHFSPTPDEIRQAAEDNHWVPDYGPDEAGLSVFWISGRWIAVWRSLEEPEDAPPEVRWTVLRIGYDPGNGLGGLTFSEV